MSAQHWHVLGAGSMGCLFASQLAISGCGVTLLLRTAPEDSAGTIVLEHDGASKQIPVNLCQASQAAAISHLLVTTKAQNVVAAIDSVAPRLEKDVPILLATNGMGYLDSVRNVLPDNPVYCCTSTEGAYRLGPLHICHAGRGKTYIGSPESGTQPQWLEDWQQSCLDAQWETRINHALWHKLAINCAINPLTALHGCLNGELARDQALIGEVSRLCDEIADVSLAAGFSNTANTVHSDVAAVIAGTADNRSSMLQDVTAGRDTEIEYITGHLLRTAQSVGRETPLNRQLFEKVIALGQ
ncbi:MAG: 2-dehydropantoate 2-reductase [Halioglobus sp.]